MMGRQSRQMAMIFVDMESLIPENHLLRKIDRIVSFDFIYTLLAPYYPAIGRPSVDPVSMFKMLLLDICTVSDQNDDWSRRSGLISHTAGSVDLN